jgi:hypothetical protein
MVMFNSKLLNYQRVTYPNWVEHFRIVNNYD